MDVEAHEYEHFSNQPRYALRPSMLRAVQATIDELQAALAIAATMTPSPACSTWFQIDPKDMFMSILRGSNKIQLINAAWKGLSGRLKRGHEFLQKYLEEFERRTHPVSPSSTVPELYEYLETEEDAEQQIQKGLETIPSHRRQLSAAGQHALTSGERRWELIVPWHNSFKKKFDFSGSPNNNLAWPIL
ncbi:uncharacterized protein ARMOST_10211 [Armillaria ostoyae]|uniref:Uncharacterized protein n=1 Tax=Armillaria ostoyae TaxID=47428 RepID=A0A284RDM2_ARMOS|nr:uncharacterized protein ARMOST_10211 [Armillaria ostoyae]